MFQANVYNVMIGAPSDIIDEIKIAEDVLQEWNRLHSKREKRVLLPLHWSKDAYPSSGTNPQKIINQQIVEKSDLMIGIFCTRIGTPTGSSESGTIEEIDEHRNAGKHVMIFFKKSCSDIGNFDGEQFKKLNAFKQTITDKDLWGEFKDATDFKEVFSQKLQLFLNDNFNDSEREPRQTETPKPSAESLLSEKDIERLKKWVSAKDPLFIIEDFLDGRRMYMLGSGNSNIVSGGREKAEWETFFEKLLKLEFICQDGLDKKGRPKYKLKISAFDFIDNMNLKTT